MKTEKIVLAFIAALIGLLVTGTIFYIYESTRKVSVASPQNNTTTITDKKTAADTLLIVSKPIDETVFSTKVVEISGKTKPDATVVVLTGVDYKVITPSSDGTFSTTINIDSDQNIIEITAIAKNGVQQKITKTVTFSTEDF